MVSFLLSTAYANQSCKNVCKNERDVYIKLCMEEEKEHWDGISSTEVYRSCRFLTYFSYLECYDECISPNRRAEEFYDKQVKNFPESNE